VEELTYDQFVGYLRSALHYLFDPVHLRRSPLVDLFGLSAEFDRAAALQNTLTTAIRALKPGEDEPPQSRAWRVYDTLNFQYVRQLAREAVAVQLGISERQLRREQRVALEALAQNLWEQLDVPSLRFLSQPDDLGAPLVAEGDQALSEELVWLKKNAPEQRIPLGEALHTVHDLVRPLAEQWQTPLEFVVPPALSDLPVAPLALRSILLTILSVAIPRAGPGSVVIAAAQAGPEIEFTVLCSDDAMGQPPLSEKEAAGLETAHNLAAFYGAHLSFPHEEGARLAVTLTLLAPETIPVLVIDDNADWLELLQRYAAGSHYQLIGTREPESARNLAEKLQPAVILLDVMMHNVDGWQILSELRHDPATNRIPIVICTILPVEDLALSLGANAFLQKPVTQHQFLKTLDHQSRMPDWASSTYPALT